MLKMAQHRKSQLIQSRCDGLAQNYDMMSNNGGFMRGGGGGGNANGGNANQSGERSITPPHSNMNIAANFGGGFVTPVGSLKQGLTIGNNQLEVNNPNNPQMNIRSIVEEEVEEGESGQLDLEDDLETMIKHHRKAIVTQ